MRSDYTHISVILDRTGSMESIRDDRASAAIAFDKNMQGTQAVWHATTQRVAAYRAGAAARVEFTEEDRARQESEQKRQ